MTATNTALISVKDLVKEYKTYDRREGVRGGFLDLFSRQYRTLRAVDGVSFEIQRGEMVGYIGANGAGKSTTIKALCGILHPTSGEVRVDGRVPWIDREEHVKHIGAVFGQRSQLWWDLAAGESLRLLARIYEVPACGIRRAHGRVRAGAPSQGVPEDAGAQALAGPENAL